MTARELYLLSMMSDECREAYVAHLLNNNQSKTEEKPTYVQCKDPYFRGVSQNIVGDALYDIGVHIIKRLIGRVRL